MYNVLRDIDTDDIDGVEDALVAVNDRQYYLRQYVTMKPPHVQSKHKCVGSIIKVFR